MDAVWREMEEGRGYSITIGAYCVMLYKEEWTLGAESGIYVARCRCITPDPFRILERDLEVAKIAALGAVKHLVDTQLFNIQSFHNNLEKILDS